MADRSPPENLSVIMLPVLLLVNQPPDRVASTSWLLGVIGEMTFERAGRVSYRQIALRSEDFVRTFPRF